MNYGQLASTGATVTIGGIVLDQVQLVGIAGGVVVLGALCIRFAFRRGKSPQEV
jgi:hypothetical protein